MKTIKEITAAHLEQLNTGKFPVNPSPGERIFTSGDEIREALQSGELVPAITREIIFRLPVSCQFGAVVGIFSPGTKKRMEHMFNTALASIGLS